MVPPWIVFCTCGRLGTGRTLKEAVTLIETHTIEALPGPRHYLTLKGDLGQPGPDVRPEPAPRPESTWWRGGSDTLGELLPQRGLVAGALEGLEGRRGITVAARRR